MPVLTILAVAVSVHTGIVALLTSRAYFRVTDNKAFAGSCPEIDPPLFLVASRHVSGLLSTFFWLVRWPSVTEVAMATCLVPFLFVPYPLILNNILEWVMYLIFGETRYDAYAYTGQSLVQTAITGCQMQMLTVLHMYMYIHVPYMVTTMSAGR